MKEFILQGNILGKKWDKSLQIKEKKHITYGQQNYTINLIGLTENELDFPSTMSHA